MRTILFGILLICTQVIMAQTADERAGALLNQKDWIGLKKEYNANKDSFSPFIRQMSEAFLDYFFNKKEDAVNSIGNLLNLYQAKLGGENTISLTYMLADNWHKMGRNEDAANLMASLCDQLKAIHTNENVIKSFESLRDQYRELANVGEILRLKRCSDKDITIPLQIDTVKTLKEGLALAPYIKGEVNGKSGRMLFDTGAGVNAVSPAIAKEYGMKMLNVSTTATGINTGTGGMAVADSMRIGELVFYNVPFYVLDMSTGNAEADRHMSELGIIIGIPVMDKLQEFQLDLVERKLIIPEKMTSNPFLYSNLYFTDGRNLLGEVFVKNDRLMMKLDTGAPSGMIYSSFYKENKEWIEEVGNTDTVRYAGFGGIHKDTVYCIPELPVRIGSSNGLLKPVNVSIRKGVFEQQGIDGLVGMDMFMLFSKVIINMKDMFIETVSRPDMSSPSKDNALNIPLNRQTYKTSPKEILLNIAYSTVDYLYNTKRYFGTARPW